MERKSNWEEDVNTVFGKLRIWTGAFFTCCEVCFCCFSIHCAEPWRSAPQQWGYIVPLVFLLSNPAWLQKPKWCFRSLLLNSEKQRRDAAGSSLIPNRSLAVMVIQVWVAKKWERYIKQWGWVSSCKHESHWHFTAPWMWKKSFLHLFIYKSLF